MVSALLTAYEYSIQILTSVTLKIKKNFNFCDFENKYAYSLMF